MHESALKIRRAESKDAEAIHYAHMKSIAEVCAPDYTVEEIKAWANGPYLEERRIRNIENDYVWVVEKAGKVEGFGHLRMGELEGMMQAHLAGLYLTPAVLGQGVGREILRKMIAEAKERLVEKIMLESTLTAHGFYLAQGFQDCGPQTTIDIGGIAVRCHEMVLDLAYL